jgi:hypothetical protein
MIIASVLRRAIDRELLSASCVPFNIYDLTLFAFTLVYLFYFL